MMLTNKPPSAAESRKKRPLCPGKAGVQIEGLSAPLEWKGIFGDENRAEVEIGSGKGAFLLHAAEMRPNVNFLGIEQANACYLYAADRVRRRRLRNVRLVRADARIFIPEFLAPESVGGFHIYFPDPWPKKRHHKRRLITLDFLRELWRCLIPGGWINLVSDHEAYFQYCRERIDASGLFDRQAFQGTPGANPGEWVGTNFERKFAQQGRKFFGLTAIKRNAP